MTGPRPTRVIKKAMMLLWFAFGLRLVCSGLIWCAFGFALGVLVFGTWFAFGVRVVCSWFALGLLLVCSLVCFVPCY